MEQQINELKQHVTEIKKQVYKNKEDIIEMRIENRNFKEDINRLIDKLDKFIDSTVNKELSKQEKVLFYLKTLVMGGVFSVIVTVMIEYLTKK